MGYDDSIKGMNKERIKFSFILESVGFLLSREGISGKPQLLTTPILEISDWTEKTKSNKLKME